MNAIAFLTLLIGQCGPNGCPQPSRQSTSFQPFWQQGAYLQCGPNGCSVVTGKWASPTYQWVPVADHPQVALYKDNVQQGNYDYEAKIYRPFQAPNTWGEPTEPPIAPPAAAQKETPEPEAKQKVTGPLPGSTINDDGVQNFGIMPDPTQSQDAPPRYQVNGKQATRDQVLQAFEGQATDQSTKLRLTVIGPRQARQVVLGDLKRTPDLQSVVRDFLLKDYDPNDWEVARSGFYTKGAPTIYVQAPSGKVLHRQDSYTGAEDLAGVLRKANDQYKAEADPNLSKAAAFGLFGIPLEAWVVIAVVLFFVVPRKDSNS